MLTEAPSPSLLDQAWQQGRLLARHFSLPVLGSGLDMGAGARRATAGQSLDFNDHRAYHHGDDLRHINWKVYANTGQLVMKTFEKEVQPQLDIVLDHSASMAVTEAKLFLHMELVSWIWHWALGAGLKPRLYLLQGEHVHGLEFSKVENVQGWPERRGEAILSLKAVPWRKRNMRVVISDFLSPQDPRTIVKPLLVDAGSCWLLSPFDQCESDPDWRGTLQVECIEEQKESWMTVDEHFKEKYSRLYAAHFGALAKTCESLGIIHQRFSAQETLKRQLLKWESFSFGSARR
jgi:uncharacterized protein (DUF58 family)